MQDDDRRDLEVTVHAEPDMEAVVAVHVLSIYPETLTESELITKFTPGVEEPRPGQANAVIQAIADLAGDGVLHRESGRVRPSRAAQRLHSLIDGRQRPAAPPPAPRVSLAGAAPPPGVALFLCPRGRLRWRGDQRIEHQQKAHQMSQQTEATEAQPANRAQPRQSTSYRSIPARPRAEVAEAVIRAIG